MNPESAKQAWTRPEVTPLTNSGSRSDNPDVAVRNGQTSFT